MENTMNRPNGKPKKKPARKGLRPKAQYSKADFLGLTRDIAKNDDGKILFSPHALARMKQRGITDIEIMNVLESPLSYIPREPEQQLNGDWRISISGVAAGRDLEVVLAVKPPVGAGNLIVVTAIKR